MEAEEDRTKTRKEMEGEIAKAMRARARDFKAQADSLTLEGVRRALEKDLGMKTFSLDVHKRFIKQCLEECFDGLDENTDKDSEKTKVIANQQEREESEVLEQSEEMKNSTAAVDEPTERPALDEDKLAKHDVERDQAKGHPNDLSEDVIKKAIKKRASYFRANLESLSLQQVRRMLEEDLKLEGKVLDAYKSFVREEIEQILQTPEAAKSTNEGKKNLKKPPKMVDEKKTNKASKRAHEGSDYSDISHSEDGSGDEEVTPKKKAAEKSKLSAKGPKRRKKAVEEKRPPSSMDGKSSKQDVNSGSDEDEDSGEEDHSRSSAEEGVKTKQEKSTQVYGKQVEHLKSIIKSSGIGIPPTVYRRVKQAPESKREAYLIKELKEILEKEGLSTDPSEKEIKEVKKRKERAKELEGIDMSNIISSSRRKTITTYIPPPKPKIEDASDDDDDEEEDEDDEDDEDDEENEENMDEGDNQGGDANEGSAEDAEDEEESD